MRPGPAVWDGNGSDEAINIAGGLRFVASTEYVKNTRQFWEVCGRARPKSSRCARSCPIPRIFVPVHVICILFRLLVDKDIGKRGVPRRSICSNAS